MISFSSIKGTSAGGVLFEAESYVKNLWGSEFD